MAEQDLARLWLRENGYGDIADLIESFIAEWKATGKHTRRNWWEILAGDSRRKPLHNQWQALPRIEDRTDSTRPAGDSERDLAPGRKGTSASAPGDREGGRSGVENQRDRP